MSEQLTKIDWTKPIEAVDDLYISVRRVCENYSERDRTNLVVCRCKNGFDQVWAVNDLGTGVTGCAVVRNVLSPLDEEGHRPTPHEPVTAVKGCEIDIEGKSGSVFTLTLIARTDGKERDQEEVDSENFWGGVMCSTIHKIGSKILGCRASNLGHPPRH